VLALLGLALAGAPSAASGAPPGMQLVPAGYWIPFHAAGGSAAGRWIGAFWLDERPVTNAEFLAFLRERPRWRRARVSPQDADASYLAHWAGELELGPQAGPSQPVTFVSWSAASSYCRAREARLPTEAEWEWAAMPAGPEEELEIRARILAFYGRPRQALPDAGASPANRYGLRDQHGVIFEWVSDFEASRAPPDGRPAAEREPDGWCGGGAAAGRDVRDYAGFMRHAFRSSLEARYALHHLGFRCARSAP
jgi:formylglycine-generating enzyme required for sulfatase activity